MSELTPNLKLFKYNTETDAKQPFSINDCMNANWDKIDKTVGNLSKSQSTNCLLEVPQRIKYTLENGTLTIKAGTQFIIPNGFESDGVTPKFDYYTLETDRADDSDFGFERKHALCMNAGNKAFFNPEIAICSSGATAPTGYQYNLWYDTVNNKIKWTADYGANWFEDLISLPLLTGYMTAMATWTSVEEVFNGFGYFAQCTWVDKDVKCLFADGRNVDGTCKNLEFTNPKLTISDLSRQISIYGHLYYSSKGISLKGYGIPLYFEQETKPNTSIEGYCTWYDTINNKVFETVKGDVYWYERKLINIPALTKLDANGNITSLKLKQPFRPVDYNDKTEISSWGMPDYTAGVAKSSGTQYTAEVDGWLEIRTDDYNNASYLTLNGIRKAVSGASNNHLAGIYCIIPIPKNATFKVVFSRTAADNLCNFYPCKGGK